MSNTYDTAEYNRIMSEPFHNCPYRGESLNPIVHTLSRIIPLNDLLAIAEQYGCDETEIQAVRDDVRAYVTPSPCPLNKLPADCQICESEAA